MSTETIKKTSITKLHRLVNDVDSLIDDSLDNFTSEEVSFILANYGDALKLTLKEPFEKRQKQHRKDSPLNDLFNT